jgi:uncharacterized protein
MGKGYISVDDHVLETPDLWTSRLSQKKWGDRIPHLERGKDGKDHWLIDGKVALGGSVGRVGALMDDRNLEPETWDAVPAEAYVPAKRLEAMDAVGQDYAVLYPTVAGHAGQAFGGIEDPDLELACVQAYNDWLIEEWAGASDRFIPQCIVPISSSEATVREIERAVAKGHRGVVFPALPMDLRDAPHVGEADYDKVWAICEKLNVPLCLHTGSSPTLEYDPYLKLAPNLARALSAVTKPVSSVYVMGLYMFTRILQRHPGLRIVFAESALSWGMLYLEWADHQADHDGLAKEGYELTPSEMFRRQCFLNSWYDRVAPFAPYIGTDNILWSTNFPLATSTWPNTQKKIDSCLENVTAEGREQILWENAANLYGL